MECSHVLPMYCSNTHVRAQGGANHWLPENQSKASGFPRVRPADTNAVKSWPEQSQTSFDEFYFPLGLGSIMTC